VRRIVYLHGFASGPSSSKARFFRERFAEAGAALEVPDLAAGDFEHLTITGQLGVLDRAVNGEPVALIGSSLGGYLAAFHAARHPNVEKLVLMAPAFDFAARFPEAVGEERMRQWKRDGVLPVFHHGEGREVPLRYDLIQDGERYPGWPEFPQPALLFHGKNDGSVPAAYSIAYAKKRINVALRLLDSDHQLLDQLDLMWREASEFLLDRETS